MDKTQEYKEWFDNYNEEWLLGAYGHTGYSYPVGYHRLRILLTALNNDDLREKKVLDIGCGGGDISFALAKRGANVIGIDMSDNMLEVANSRKRELMNTIIGTVEFQKENVQALSSEILRKKFDYIIAFGLIGYLESDEQFFEIIETLSKKDTVLFLSCRNELFNVTSISSNTLQEINSGNITNLIEEINKKYEKEISHEKGKKFLNELSNSIRGIKDLEDGKVQKETKEVNIDETQMISFARQSTPEGVKKVAEKYNYNFCKYWGVHPHLLLPRFNKKLPPQFFNILSDALCVFEDEEISLVWSSVFIGKFEYRYKKEFGEK